MAELNYSIHDIMNIRVENPTRSCAGDMNRRMGYFLTGRPADAPDIRVKIGPFAGAREGCYSLDHKYYISKDRISFSDTDKGLAWNAHISGIENGQVDVLFDHAPGNLRKFPWLLFPDMVMHLYLLQPLMEFVLAKKGYYLLHAGAVCKNGEAAAIFGRGGAFKTSMVMQLLKSGYEFMSDDFILVRGDEVLAFPTNQLMFEFSALVAGREALTLVDQFRFLRYMGGRRMPAMKIVPRARLKAAMVLLPYEGEQAHVAALSADDFCGMAGLNQRLEKRAYVSFNYVIGDFLDAYRMVFPASGVCNDTIGDAAALESAVRGKQAYAARIPSAGRDVDLRGIIEKCGL